MKYASYISGNRGFQLKPITLGPENPTPNTSSKVQPGLVIIKLRGFDILIEGYSDVLNS